ncbi:hypothetical protein SDC9_113686 [bioreactor metagenome]|uniref:Spore germination protein B1 n=1 Tax=bioreactor metagenome TaxID=1076179 RepID=A0A645BNE2_9ZZZZ
MGEITLERLKQRLSKMFDVQYRELCCRLGTVYMIHVHSMCDLKDVSDFVVRPLSLYSGRVYGLHMSTSGVLQTGMIKDITELEDAVSAILSGNILILLPELDQVVCCDMRGYKTRNVEVTQSETVIKGPREGFTEDLRTNLSEVRRRVKTPDLKMERFFLGQQSQTETVLIYLSECAPEKLVNFVRDKIQGIQKQYVFYNNYLEDEIRNKFTPFDTVGYTEKPDVAVSKLAEGRVVVITDGIPIAVTAPMFFIENFQTTDDYTLNPIMANLGRGFRWIAFFLSTLAPGLYLALITYHFKLVPTVFLYRLALFRAGVPVPTVIELLYMMIFFQIIREAGVRLPQPIGPTLSIVGALILGESAVASGLASQFTVVVVAITSIGSYLVPMLQGASFFFSMLILFMSAMLGLPGFYMGFCVFAAHLAGLTSCGYPYLYPFGTEKTFRFNDVFWRGDLNKKAKQPLSRNEAP